MAVISITLTESQDQVLVDIPRSVTIETNIPSTIFYTLDGTTPTISSSIYIDELFLPTNSGTVILKVFATNGIDSSSVITYEYVTSYLDNTRLPRAAVDIQTQPVQNNILYPFGDPQSNVNTQPIFENPANATIPVDDPTLTEYPTGYDANMQNAGFTNKPFTIENYQIQYSTTNEQGEVGPNIGTLPAQVSIQQPTPAPEESNYFDRLFDPRAYVIYQDASKENPNDPPVINSQFFSLINNNTYSDGNQYLNSGLDSPGLSGSFVRREFNARNNTVTYYYYDNRAGKWIISTAPYNQNNNKVTSMSVSIAPPNKHKRFVYEWIPFFRRHLG